MLKSKPITCGDTTDSYLSLILEDSDTYICNCWISYYIIKDIIKLNSHIDLIECGHDKTLSINFSASLNLKYDRNIKLSCGCSTNMLKVAYQIHNPKTELDLLIDIVDNIGDCPTKF